MRSAWGPTCDGLVTETLAGRKSENNLQVKPCYPVGSLWKIFTEPPLLFGVDHGVSQDPDKTMSAPTTLSSLSSSTLRLVLFYGLSFQRGVVGLLSFWGIYN